MFHEVDALGLLIFRYRTRQIIGGVTDWYQRQGYREPGYVVKSDLEENPEEYEDDETEDGLVDYPIDRGEDGDDDDGNSSGDYTKLLSKPIPPAAPSPTYLISLPSARERLARCMAPSAHSSPPPVPSLLLPSYSTIDAEERRQGIREVRYGIRDTWVDPAEAVPEITPMTIGERVDLLMRDRMTPPPGMVLLVEEEAYASQEAWAHAIGLSQAVHYEFQTHYEQAQAQIERPSAMD
ncbi:hypothetical protein Tco_0582661 [Tanacetum coccineum]